jgi:DNA-binding beta-propeller fold protein YncE
MSAARAAALSLLLFTAMSIAMPNAAHATGELTFDQCYGDHAGCESDAGTELATLSGVAVSPDGTAVYVTGTNSVAHFIADPTSGKLVYDSCLSDTSGLCLGDGSAAKPLGGAEGLVVDPDHPAVFVAGRTVGDAVQLRTLPSNALLYGGCVSDNGSGGLCGETERTVLSGAKGVAVSPDGDALYVSAFGVKPSFEGFVSHFSVAPEGQITFRGCVSSDGSGTTCGKAGGSKLLRETVGIAVSPNDASLYSASESGVISHYAIDPASRQFTWTDCVSNDGSAKACEDVPGSGEPLLEAEQVAVSPDGRSLYTTSRETVSHFETGPSGQLKWEGCVSSSVTSQCAQLIGPKELLNVTEGIAVSPDGKSLYVGSASAITSFTLGAEGQLAFQGCWTSQATAGCSDLPGEPLEFIDSLAVSPNGASVYAASSGGDLVHLFRTLPTASPPGGSNSGTGGSITGTGGSITGAGSQTTAGQVVSAAAIKASLLLQLAPKGKAAKIAQLAGKKRYAYSFKALTAGMVTINWYVVPTGAHLAGKAKPKPVLFAGGHVAFTAAGTKTITIKLTGPGLAMLKHHHQLKLTAKGSFTRPSSAAITALKTFTLKH